MARPKGAKNVIQAEVKREILRVYHRLGGIDRFHKWAARNEDQFYKFFVSLAPKEVTAEITHRTVTEMSDAELAAIATGSSAGTVEEAGGEAESTPVH